MVQCVQCGKGQSKLNSGDLCKGCFAKARSEKFELGLNDDIIANLPTLPDSWYSMDISELNTGHFVRIMMGYFQPLTQALEALDNRVVELETITKKLDIVVTKEKETVEELSKEVKSKATEITQLKKAVYNQQIFLENVQKKELMNNVIITGIPNDNVTIDDITYQSNEEKVALILTETCDINTEDYEITPYKAAENRLTYVCKVVFKDFEMKMKVLKNAMKLKQNNTLKTVYLKWDEPKLTRQENYRLRKMKRELISKHPNDKVELKKGVLTHNDIQCDKFDLTNQIF